MGAWGHKPNENDSAGDLMDRVSRETHRAAEKLFRKKRVTDWDKWARVGVVYQLTLWSPSLVDYDTVKRAIDDLDDLGDDEEFVESWNDPAAFRRSLASTQKYFQKLKRAY